MKWITPVATATVFNRPILRGDNGLPVPYPDAKERELIRQRFYNRTYYRRIRQQILLQKKGKRDELRSGVSA